MRTSRTIAAATLSLLSLLSMIGGSLVQAQVTTVQKIVQQETMVQPTTTVESTALLQTEARSDYATRLSHMMEQINLASQRGWLTPQKADELRKWHDDCQREVAILRSAGGGTVRRQDVEQLERHVTGLAYVIAREINSGHAIAGQAKLTF